MEKQIYLIRWVDIVENTPAWRSIEEAIKTKPVHVQTVGHLLAEFPDYYVFAPTLADGETGSEVAIPRGCILELIPIYSNGVNIV